MTQSVIWLGGKGRHLRLVQVSRDRPKKFCVLLQILNILFYICLAALSFLPKEIGGVFVDFSGYNKEYSEFG